VRHWATALAPAALLAWAAPAGAADPPGAAAAAAQAMPRSLTGRPGDAARGRDIVLSRERGNCIACHEVPAPDRRFHGDVGPSLDGIAARLGEAELRARLVDARRVTPSSIMPAYHRVDGFRRVAAAYAGRPVLTAEEVEDVLAFLMTLR